MSKFQSGGRILMGGNMLGQVLDRSSKVFVICDPFLVESGGISYITDELNSMGVSYEVFSGIQPDPTVDIVMAGMEKLLAFEPNVSIAIGGGSAIDAAKAMVYFSRKENLLGEVEFVAIPTTSGTGSEVTSFSVITDSTKGVKYPLITDEILPDVAILDPKLTITVPPAITAATGMDVLTHAIEAMVSTEATDFSDAMAEKAIKLVRSHLLRCYKEPENMESRQAIHNASTMAGIAFNNSGLGLNHGMAHALGGRFHTAHGKANAVLLPYVMGYNAGCFDSLNDNAKKYARIARLVKVDSASVRQSAFNLIRSVKKINEDLKIPSTIKDLGIDEEEFLNHLDGMAKSALEDRCTATNPRVPTFEEVRELYLHAYYGRVIKK